MSKFKKIFATMIGTAMSANILLTMPFSVFADNISQTFEFDGYTVEYDVKNSWGNTDVISLTLTNTGTETIEDWMLYFDPNGEIQYVNDAIQMTTTNGIGYIKNPGYNADIDPGASVEFRYAVNNCEEIPDDYKFCQSRITKETGYDVSLKVNYTWGSNNEYFNGEIIIQNDTDAPIEAWELKADTNFTITEITNSWAADVTELESYNYMLKGTYTSIIPVGGSISLGFNGMKEGEPIISDYSLTEVVVDESVINSIINGDNKDDEFYDDCIDWSTLPDSDGDGLPDEYEEEYGCDPTNPDTDGDGLPDGYEIMTIDSNPADAYSLDNTLSDGEYDNDQDGLSNYEEYLLGTDPLRADSDFDGLSDGDEVNVYGTDPLNPDTDGDGLSDGDEIALGLNPLVADSNEDEIPDNEEKFSQSMTYNTEDSDTVIDSINVSFEGTGYIKSNTSISPADEYIYASNLVGIIGTPFRFETSSKFDNATIQFQINTELAEVTKLNTLGIVWYDSDFQQFRLLECIYEEDTSTIIADVPHFSIYCVVNIADYISSQGFYYFMPNDDLTDADQDGIPDCYESSTKDTPENTFHLSNSVESFSLKGVQDSDGDGLHDGEEILYCMIGDINRDGVINKNDNDLLQSYLRGTENLSGEQKSSADCDLNGEITETDLFLIQKFIENGYTSGDEISHSVGDINSDGVRTIVDLIILQKFLLAIISITDEDMLERADVNGDNFVNIFDLTLMKQYIIENKSSLVGYCFFYCVSDPMLTDSDRDGIMDSNEIMNITTDSRYDNLNPMVADTVESLFPELTDSKGANQKNNAVYLDVNGNEVIIKTRILFDGDYDKIAVKLIKEEKQSQIIAERLGENFTYKDAVLDGIKQRWSGEYLGNIYDFYPGMVTNVSVEIDVLNSKPRESSVHYTKINCVSEIGRSGTRYGRNINENKDITLYLRRESTPTDLEIVRYEGTIAHEFGHTLLLSDAYPDTEDNRKYAPVSSEEIYYDNTGLNPGLIGSGEIMYVEGNVLPNDIEMMLIGYSKGEWQRFVPSSAYPISEAIKEPQIYIKRRIPPYYYDLYTWNETAKEFFLIDEKGA